MTYDSRHSQKIALNNDLLYKNGDKIKDDAGKQDIFLDIRSHLCKGQVLAVLCQLGSRFVLYECLLCLLHAGSFFKQRHE